MNLDAIMKMAIKHQQQQELEKTSATVMLEILMLTVGRNISCVDLNCELSKSCEMLLSKVNIDNDRGSTEAELELVGTLKNAIIETIDNISESY